jgi:putative transposase
MKKPYQIETQRAVKQLAEMAADGNPAVQMVLPMAEMVGWLRKGVGELTHQAGLQLMDLLMQEEVREPVDERSQRQAERTASRWGSERGYCVVMGQKVPIERPRVRTPRTTRKCGWAVMRCSTAVSRQPRRCGRS